MREERRLGVVRDVGELGAHRVASLSKERFGFADESLAERQVPGPALEDREAESGIRLAARQTQMAVDRERGWDDEGSAQILWMLLADVEAQVFGVKATPSVREKKPSTGRRRTVREI